MSVLIEAVLAGGVFFPAGTGRQGEPAELIPDGPWWSGDAPAVELNDGEPTEPPRAGEGSGVEAWRSYAAAAGVEVSDDASRDDIIAAVDAR